MDNGMVGLVNNEGDMSGCPFNLERFVVYNENLQF